MLEYQQVTSQKQTLKINPQQIQFLNLLQLGEYELDAYLANETVENPFLQEAKSTDKSYTLNCSSNIAEQNNWLENQSRETSFQDYLLEQLSYLFLNENELAIARFIVSSLDEKGFLKHSTEEIAEDFGFNCNKFIEEEEVNGVLLKLSKLEPKGIGVRDITEYLSLQLDNYPLTKSIIVKHIEDVGAKNYEAISQSLGITIGELKDELCFISKLNPYPAYGYAHIDQTETNKIFPEYKIEIEGDIIIGSLVKKSAGKYIVDKSYLKSLGKSKESGARKFLKSKLFSANWIVEALQQREETMSVVLEEIIGRQEAFFKSGGDYQELKPMILKDIAERVDLTISTISRVTSNKFLDTPFGTICLKNLFSESIITTNGEVVSNKEVQNKVEVLIDNENKIEPLTDKQISYELSRCGIQLTRRTITKYRENLNISSSKLRRTLGQ